MKGVGQPEVEESVPGPSVGADGVLMLGVSAPNVSHGTHRHGESGYSSGNEVASMHCAVVLGLLAGPALLVLLRTARAADVAPMLGNACDSQVGAFRSFQRQYLAVFLLSTFSDWLKGPYVYALYESYGMSPADISWLYVGGFASSLFFGTLVGSWSDRFGRKRMCHVFCVVYVLSALTKPVNTFWVLLLGRVLGGIATSLLFTSFEAWMIAEHRRREFPDEWLTSTFSRATLGNGLVAIVAGLVAQLAAEAFGYAAPFLVAVPCLLLAGGLACSWTENYGSKEEAPVAGPLQMLVEGALAVRNDRALAMLGACQAFFEAAMYVWVFYWTPAIVGVDTATGERVTAPLGLMHATFMVAFLLGGSLSESSFAIGFGLRRLTLGVHAASVCILLFSWVVFESKVAVFAAFVAFEAVIGCYFPLHGTLRSSFIPESTRASVMNLFRFPMNLMVVLSLEFGLDPQSALLYLVVMLALSLASCVAFQKKAHLGV